MTKHTYDDAYKGALEYFGGDTLAADVWASKYALRDTDGNFLETTPRQMFERIACEVARAESRYPDGLSYDEVLDAIVDFAKVVPQGSPMSAIGDTYRVKSLSNCFVIEGPHDSYAGILSTDEEQVQIMKRRGGVGFDLSRIRPRGTPIANAAVVSDGVVGVMHRYSFSTRSTAQGGRRGALMLTISCRHPDVLDFIRAKRDQTSITGANISVRFDDVFMRAVEEDAEVVLKWPVDVPDDEAVVKRVVRARELWNEFIESAHGFAEPGALFWDTARRMSPADIFADDGFGSTSTNPCGEIILSPYDSCRLTAINVASFVVDPFTDDARFDWDMFGRYVRVGQRIMDAIVDLELEAIDRIIEKVESDPEPEAVKRRELEMWRRMRDAAERGRRTGLGVTAVGDAVAMMGYRYGNDDSIDFVEEVYRTLCVNAYTASIEMAKDRGAFPVWRSFDHDMTSLFLRRVAEQLPDEVVDMWRRHGRRNIACTTTAPCGTISLMTRTTSGIEPTVFISCKRARKATTTDDPSKIDYVDDVGDPWILYDVLHPGVVRWMRANGWSEERIASWNGDVSELEGCPYVGATAMDIDFVRKVSLQSRAQRWVCHAISNTVNLPEDITKDVVSDLYIEAWRTGCKGLTVYRQGSRSGVIIASDDAKDDDEHVIVDVNAVTRPDELPCHVHRVKRSNGDVYYFFVGVLGDRPYEVFGTMFGPDDEVPREFTAAYASNDARLVRVERKSGNRYDVVFTDSTGAQRTIRDIVKQMGRFNYAIVTRFLSTMLRHGIPVSHIVEQLKKERGVSLTDFNSIVSRVLKDYVPDGAQVNLICQACGSRSIVFNEGCEMCMSCGASACG